MAKTATVMINGEEKKLAYPVGALIKLETQYGIKMADLGKDGNSESLDVILKMIWAGLIHENPELTVDELGFMIDITELPEIAAKFGDIFGSMTKNSQK
ncbi:hypothetical protein [Rummeliibacillus stabekisii]|uniref:hypothetical protein n=1 Tax=Rummeliibacillus stabekisii TaxID=241244 RepID=UPI00372280D7